MERPARSSADKGIVATAATIAAWNEMICGAAAANGFVCADISTAFNGKDGTLRAGDLLAAHHVHPSHKGYAVIAGVLADFAF